jgi:hypothetical protein
MSMPTRQPQEVDEATVALEEWSVAFESMAATSNFPAKCPRFARRHWFFMIDTFAFIAEHMDEIAGHFLPSPNRIV